MKIKNDYVKIKQGKKEIELHNLILNRYLNLFAYSLLNNVEKGLHVCLINCTSEETITPSMSTMNYDFVLEEDNRYNNDDYKGKNKIITKYLYRASQQTTITPYVGRKIYSIGFGQESTSNNSDDYELYAILDVSSYNLYIQESQNFIVERVDTVTTDLKFYSQTEKYPIHLSPRGNSYFDQQEETGTHEVAILNRIGKGYNSMFPTALMPKSNFNITRNENEIDITGLSIQENTGEELYPSNELYPTGKWSEEIQKSEKGSEVIIEGNDKEAFVSIEGKSEQATRSGKNMLNVTATSRTYDGTLSVTVNDDKSITLNGTNTSGETIYYRLGDNLTLSVGTYTLSNHNDNCNPRSTYGFYDDGNNFDRTKTSTKTFSNTVTIKPYIRINAGITVNNQTIYPMIEQGSSMTDYEQYGVTPSPDYPSEIHSVADDVNLFNKEKASISSGAIKTVLDTGVRITLSSSGTYRSCGIEIGGTELLGKTITLYSKITPSSNNKGAVFIYYGNSSNMAVSNAYANITNTGSLTKTLVSEFPTNCDRVYALFYGNRDGTGNNDDYVDYTNLKIQYGDTATPYSPYNQGTVTIKQRGKNLWTSNLPIIFSDRSSIVQDNNNGGIDMTIASSTSLGYIFYDLGLISDFAGKTLTFSISNEPNALYRYCALMVCNADGSNRQELKNFTSLNNQITYTIGNSYSQTHLAVRLYIAEGTGGQTYSINNVQVEENSEKTSYEPYQGNDYTIQTEPLRSLPNGVKDTIEEDGIHRRVGRIVLDGSEDWRIITNLHDGFVRYYISGYNIGRTSALSDYFLVKDTTSTSTENILECRTNGAILINTNVATTLEDFKTWLSTHNVEAIYELATEVIEPFTEEQMEVLRSIQTFEGYNNFTTTDDLQPVIQVTEYENCVYPKTAQMNWVFYEFSVYKFIDTVTGYQDTGRKYYISKNTNNSGNLSLKIKYERGE